MASSNVNEWDMTTDVYGIVDSLNNLKKNYINDEDETTLALGIFGYMTDVEAKKIQTSTIMTGHLGNEMFPTRANLTKNVLAHAIYCNIDSINAVPAIMTLNIGIRVEDFEKYADNGKFVFDMDCPIFVGDYEFHFDYDIILLRSKSSKTDSYVYSAHYDMSIPNRLSSVTDPYLKQPFVVKIGEYDYIVFQARARQITIEETVDKIITDSIIENKTYSFNFDNQIADFDVIVVDNGVETRLQPLFYGTSSEGVDNYCWYLFISNNTIRITFDSKSYIPGLNSDITIRAYTTLGAGGVFNYKKIDETSDGFYIDFTSTKYNYDNITCYMIAVSDSANGTDRKSKSELQKMIPKAALSRGAITTETDVSNYFNLIDSESNRLVMKKKVDNQFSRIWYSYFVLKDELMNIIPTNSTSLQLNILNGSMNQSEDGRYILPAGSIISFNKADGYAKVIDESKVPELFSDEYFGDNYYYMTVYNIILNPDPLYAAFYLAISNTDSFFTFNWVNEESKMQFIGTRCSFQRNLLTDQQMYKLNFKIVQSISNDFELYIEENVVETDSEGNNSTKTIITNNVKTVLVLYKDNNPYRWVEGTLTGFNGNNYSYDWMIELETDNELDINNNIKINNLHVAGSKDSINYGYFAANTKATVYTLAKFDQEYGRFDLDDIAPGFDGYSVTNVYNIDSGINFYENFTNVLDTRVYADEANQYLYKLSGVPVVGLHYMISEDNANYLVDSIDERKAYIDYCLELLENSMDIDFKFFNTYGPSYTYTIGDSADTSIGHIDMVMKFRVSLKNISDIYIKDNIAASIKAYIEDLNETEDLHVPAMITALMNEYSDRVNFIEFVNFNDFPVGIQHITLIDDVDPKTVPEFINIRNRYNVEGDLEPDIDIEVVY